MEVGCKSTDKHLFHSKSLYLNNKKHVLMNLPEIILIRLYKRKNKDNSTHI